MSDGASAHRSAIAMIGCGSIGRRHLSNLRDLGCTRMLAYDPDSAALERLAAAADAVQIAPSLEAVWAWRPEIVFVTSPSHLHLEHAMAAAERGCDLFIEKPLAHAPDGLDRLEGLTSAKRLVTMVGCNMRFHPGPTTVKRLLDSGVLGPVLFGRLQTASYLPDWRPGTDYDRSYSADAGLGGGAVLDCIHEIDLALWYFGPGRLHASVARRATSLGLEIDGLAEVLINHDNGALSSVHLSVVQRDYKRGSQVVCEAGTIYWDFAQPEVRIVRGHGAVETRGFPRDWSLNQMYVDEIAYFLDCVRTRRQTMCSVADGRRALTIALGARSAAGVS